ncbi:hypothetical protein [Nocardia salmonicida]|uniref:ATP dependent DNA ligase n=1 Tax=Nocardia salmonicida TaxID=53431 RepID=UPI0039A4969C
MPPIGSPDLATYDSPQLLRWLDPPNPPDGPLCCIGGVGTGFTAASRRSLRAALDQIGRETNPLDDPPPASVARTGWWVEPVFVADLEYGEISGDGLLRHPSFRGSELTRHPTSWVCPTRAKFGRQSISEHRSTVPLGWTDVENQGLAAAVAGFGWSSGHPGQIQPDHRAGRRGESAVRIGAEIVNR